MKYLKKKEKKSKPIGMILLVIILLLAAFACGTLCGTMLNSGGETQDTQPAQQTQPQETESVPTESSAAEEEPAAQQSYVVSEIVDDDLVVSTPYGEVRYAAQFEEFLRITHEFADDRYVVHFNADVGVGEVVNIFSVYFVKDNGKQPDGTVIGGFQNENGKMDLVIVTVNADLPRAEWDDDTANLIYAMQEGISYCMEQLGHLDGLTLAE